MDLELARAFFEESRHDLNTAKLAMSGGEFSKTVQHSCDAAEKAAKALLTLDGRGTIPEHKVSDFISELVGKYPEYRSELTEIVRDMSYLEDFSGKTRYPIRIRGRLVIPSECFDKDDADNCLSIAGRVLKGIDSAAWKIFKVKLLKEK